MNILNTNRSCGFTLLELLVTVALVSIISYAMALYFDSIYDSINKRNAEVQVLHDLRYAQALTVERGCRGIFTVAADYKSYTFGCDYVPYSTANPPVSDSNLFTRDMPSGVLMSVDALILFNSRGQVINSSEALQTRYVTLKIVVGSTQTTFNVGTLRPTGFFTYSN